MWNIDDVIVYHNPQVQFLRDTSHVVVMAEGKIAEQGTYEKLSAKTGGMFAELVASSQGEASNEGHGGGAGGGGGGKKGGKGLKKEHFIDLSKDKAKSNAADGKLVGKEGILVGTTPWPVFKEFFRAGGEGKFFTAFLAITVFFISEVAQLANDAWLAVWSNQGNFNSTDPNDDDDENWMNLGDKSVGFFLGIYGGIAFTFYLLVAWRSLLMVGFQINASRYFHSTMLASTLRATMAFFETTPGGQILNRFTRDVYEPVTHR